MKTQKSNKRWISEEYHRRKVKGEWVCQVQKWEKVLQEQKI